MAEFSHTRGDSFIAIGQFVPPEGQTMAGYTGRAHIRSQPDGPLVDSFVFTWTNSTTGEYSIQKIDTRSWPITDLLFDVEVKNTSTGWTKTSGPHKIKTALDVSHD